MTIIDMIIPCKTYCNGTDSMVHIYKYIYGHWPLVSLIGWLRLPEKENTRPTSMQKPCEKLQGPLTYFCMPCYGPGWAHWGGPLRCRQRPGTRVRAPVWTSSIVVSHAPRKRTRSNFVPDACTKKENKKQSCPRGKTSLLSVSHNCWEGQAKVKVKAGANYLEGCNLHRADDRHTKDIVL